MLDLRQYNSMGAALSAALDRWPDEICLIEADRERENARLTYRQFKEAALPLARAMQSAGFQNGTRAAIIMTNQSKWLISAYAIFYCGGVLVPLDYKLTPAEQLKLLAHSQRRIPGDRIPSLARHHAGRGIQESRHPRGPGDRSPSERRSRRRKTLGRISRRRIRRTSVRPARAHTTRRASSIPPAPAAAPKAASSRTIIISSNASRSPRSIRSGPACVT